MVLAWVHQFCSHQAPVSGQPSVEERRSAYPPGYVFPVLIRSVWPWLVETSLIYYALFLPHGRPTPCGEPVGLTTFHIIELRMGWVSSIRRNRGCLWMNPLEVHHPMWLMPSSWSSILPTGCIYDAYEDSLTFSRVRGQCCHCSLPSEPCLRLSRYTAQANHLLSQDCCSK